MNLKKKKKGFTLIELMAVIAIIAVLAAVLVPTVSGYITRSKKTAVITQIRNAVTAIETYNATSVGTNVIDNKRTIVDVLSTSSNTPKLEEDFLTGDDINRLGNLVISVAQKINNDPNAISNLKVNNDGTFKSYYGKGADGVTPVQQ